METLKLTVLKKCLPFGNKNIDRYGINLHRFQEVFYADISNLNNVNFIVAPTGAGKTFSFSFPIIYAKDNKYYKPLRGLIVVPTNALAEDIEKTLQEQDIKVNVITGSTLKKKGKERGEEIFKVAKNSEIVITNPDILNYMMNSGYHLPRGYEKFRYLKNFPDWTHFFDLFDYIIFDEYHLYDEEQLGVILVLFLATYKFSKNIKWFFVSATPEVNLIDLFNENGIKPSVIEQPLSNEGRTIQGEMEIKFIKISKNIERSLYGYLVKNGRLNEEIRETIKKALLTDEKVLMVFNSLRDAMNMKYLIEKEVNARIWINTGLQTKEKENSKITNVIDNSDIIITTSKAEVGVNYPVSLCFMDAGMYLRNFMQRIGRVGRGKEKCKIYCTVNSKIFNRLNELKKTTNENEKLNYYEFVNLMNNAFEDREFKKDKVPKFCGAVLWSVINSMEEYDRKLTYQRKDILKELTERFPYYWTLYWLNEKIGKIENDEDEDIIDEDTREELLKWWESFKNSFRRFRKDSVIWKVIYEDGKETEYDLLWILDNAFVEVDRENKVVIIKDFREKRAMAVRGIETFSLFDKDCPSTIGGTDKGEWFKFLYSDYIGDILTEKFERWKISTYKYFEDKEFFEEFVKNIEALSPIYSKKRIEIYDLVVDEGEVFGEDIL
ncbi:MAG: CRISPR-associated endonuclease/helicase Cas3 [Methanothermococcus sp.]|jgi:CRISPR-associated endonuclease/helicase Cas3|uniref:type I-D CRISPR-associated helicase Cas3' n=1 Tax=Methanothermococcus sp. TaxID=2614238 RepID=UPI002583F549|nr:type I-D CRISPR-associated helicase Cas3' [Methanothermococcus sp.]MDK2790241.1 CRISPR-associated endonuclease/helicase Cas3 [Methanothermococcus sp.]MDK2978638.1 CRISPR-associated endonuclease/helicase Cas3 [Bacteroidales bacterium]MDK2987657.1 CRISPR-associated endonuclease/helicase Cas3 [Methanothermococcus sp.]